MSEFVGVAVLKMASLIISAVALGLYALYSATAPLTCGAAIDEPLNDL